VFLHRFRLRENASGSRSDERHAVERVKKLVDTRFFTPDVLPQSGMIGKTEYQTVKKQT